jgi:hypothetical protein
MDLTTASANVAASPALLPARAAWRGTPRATRGCSGRAADHVARGDAASGQAAACARGHLGQLAVRECAPAGGVDGGGVVGAAPLEDVAVERDVRDLGGQAGDCGRCAGRSRWWPCARGRPCGRSHSLTLARPMRHGALGRVLAWAITGPLGHLWSASADITLLWLRYGAARARAGTAGRQRSRAAPMTSKRRPG